MWDLLRFNNNTVVPVINCHPKMWRTAWSPNKWWTILFLPAFFHPFTSSARPRREFLAALTVTRSALPPRLVNLLRLSHICSGLSECVITSLWEIFYHYIERERPCEMGRLAKSSLCVVTFAKESWFEIIISWCVAQGGAEHLGSDKVLFG